MDLHVQLRTLRKGLINIKNKDKKCSLRCHIRHINPLKEHPERIKKMTKKLLKNLIIMGLSFLYKKIEIQNYICIYLIGYDNRLVFPIYILDQKFEDSMNLLLLIDDDKSYHVYSKNFDRF